MAATGGKRRSFNTDLDHLRECFNEVDHLKSGFIGLEELTKLVNSMPDTGDSVVADLMEKLDRDKDGKVSFHDFVWLYELEQESTSKKQKLTSTNQTEAVQSPTSPAGISYGSGDVVLRRNPRRMTMPARLHRNRELSLLSPILSDNSPAEKRPPSNDVTDLASQMKYLTDASASIDSPQLKRSSKVLSWIESEDLLFEDTGTGLRGGELPSPPMSPTDESSQIGSILELVCNTKEVSSTAIAKLCDHVKADPQEQQELNALLNHLDKDNKGYVSTTEFAQGLQAIKNSVAVGSMTPTNQLPHRKGFREVAPPRLSEPFSTPQGTKPPPLSSTPVVPSAATNILLTAIDHNQSGYVKVNDIVNYWQSIGIETPHDQSLENILTASLPADHSGYISVGDLTATLEASLTDGKSQNVFRQVALKSFKKEITALGTQVHQVSMERDKLKTSLNRTIEEKSKLITEGDEHVEIITKRSEKEKRRQQAKYFERIKEVEKAKQEESLQLQERASNAIRDLEARMKELKEEEEKLREDLKFANEDIAEVTQQLAAARKEMGKKDRTIAMLQKDLGSRSEHDIIDDESHMHRMNELENEVSDKIALISELQDKLRETQDKCDELKAENERMRQKNIAQKRSMQKSYSLPNTRSTSAKRRSSRPLSGTRFHRHSRHLNPQIPTSMDLDLAVQKQNHPVLQEEGQEEEEDEVDFVPPHLSSVQEHLPESEAQPLEETPESNEESTDTEEDVFAKSTASLMEEIQQEKLATLERRQSKDFNNQLDIQRRKHEEIVTQLKQEIFRLEEFSESQQEQALKMEEEKSLALQRAKELQYEVESERKSHEVEVNILSRKLENSENDVTKLYRDLKQMTKERELIQQDHEARLLKVETKAEAKISALQNELLRANVTISEQSSLQSELSQVKERLETQKKEFVRKSSDALAKLEGKHMERTKTIKSKHDMIVKNLQKELNASEQREKNLRDQLDSSCSKLDIKAKQIHDLQSKAAVAKREILAFETSQGQYLSEVSKLQGDVAKLQVEISHMKSAATAYKNKISSLKAELQRGSEFEDSLLSNSRRSSTASEASKHEEILTKMKAQLEELQEVLESKTVNDKDGNKHKVLELELINKLTSNSSALDAEIERMRRGFSAERLSHKQACSQKDELLDRLQIEKDMQRKVMTDLLTDASEGIAGQIDSLQSSCSFSLVRYRSQLDKALLNLANIAKCLKDKDVQHASTVDTLFSDLDHTHKEIRHVKVDAGSGQVISDHDDSPTRQQELLEKDMIIHALNSEIDQLKQAERLLTEEVNKKLLEKEREMRQAKSELENLHRKARELELKLQQKTCEPDRYMDEISKLKNSLQLAKEELKASKRLLQQQHSLSIEIEEKHASELQSVHKVLAKSTSEARELYSYLLDSSANASRLPLEYVSELDHSQTITETKKEVDRIMEQFIQQQGLYVDLEAILAGKIEEHDILEAQFTAEHEEEVRALRQQKHHLMKQIEEIQQHYQNILDDQEEQSEATIQELVGSRSDLEKQLKGKTEESLHVYQQMADLSEEKRVLVEIIKQLCVESVRPINVV